MYEKEIALKFGAWLKPRFSKYELILVLVSAVAIILKLLNINGASMIFSFSLGFLAILYFFSAYSPLDIVNLTSIDSFVKYLSFWALSIVVIGIQFYLSRLIGYEVMLMFGSFILICSSIYSIVRVLKADDTSDYYKSMAIRLVCYLAICLFLQIAPKEQVRKVLHIPDNQVEQAMGR